MLFFMTWNGLESKWSTFFPRPKPIHRSLNLLRSHRLPASTDETDPISPSEPFFDLPHSAGGSLLPSATAVPGQFHLSSPSRDQRQPSFLEVHPVSAKEPGHR